MVRCTILGLLLLLSLALYAQVPVQIRTNNVRADTTLLQICCPGSHEGADCRFTRGVDPEGGRTLNTRDRAVENDGSPIREQR